MSADAIENAAPQARTEWEDSPNKQIGVREGKVLAEHVRALRKMPVDAGKSRSKAFSIHGLPLFRGRIRIDGPSFDPVLQAMGVAPEVGMSEIRFSLGRDTTQGEIDIVVDQLANILASAP